MDERYFEVLKTGEKPVSFKCLNWVPSLKVSMPVSKLTANWESDLV